MKSMSQFGMRKGLVIIVAAAMELAAVGGRAADPILSSQLMYVPFDADNATYGSYRARLFRILDQKGMDKGKGTALSEQASEVAEWPLYGKKESEYNGYFGSKWFPTGGEGQAVAFPVDGNWKDGSGSVVFWVKGTGWDVTTPRAEELITLESAQGNVVFGKTAPKTLTLAGPGAAPISVPIDFTPDRLHLMAITYAGKTVTIYVDGQSKAENAPFALPAKIKRIVVGQTTPGGKTNKVIDDLFTYDRPLLTAEVNRLAIGQGLITGRKLIAVTKTRAPIHVDGILDPAEWGQAAEVTGLLKIGCASIYDFSGPADVAADQSQFWVTYDDEYLLLRPSQPAAGQDRRPGSTRCGHARQQRHPTRRLRGPG